MTIENKNNELILKIPSDFDSLGIQRVINYLKYREKIVKSKATEAVADELAEESKQNWWTENKSRFIK